MIKIDYNWFTFDDHIVQVLKTVKTLGFRPQRTLLLFWRQKLVSLRLYALLLTEEMNSSFCIFFYDIGFDLYALKQN